MKRFNIPERWLRIIINAAALQPLASIFWAWLNHDLTVNPIQDLTLRSGKAALIMLVASLSCTPLNSLFGFRQAIKYRRTLGLYAFLYASMHLAIFAVVDYGLDLHLIFQAIEEKRYIIAGFSAFLILLLLAITSFQWWQKSLGKSWKGLHRLVYLAASLVIVHYVWLVKADIRVPLLFGALVGVLLLVRIPDIKRKVLTLIRR